jgi:hypothetical protein
MDEPRKAEDLIGRSSAKDLDELAGRVEKVLALDRMPPRRPNSSESSWDEGWYAGWASCREHVLRLLDGEEP